MKQEASDAHQKISDKSNDKNGVVTMFSTAYQTCIGKVYEKQVGQCIDYLGYVGSGIVVLAPINNRL